MVLSWANQLGMILANFYQRALQQLSQPLAMKSLAIVGGLTSLYVINALISSAWLFLRPSDLPKSRHPSGQPYLTYALVTGSSDGIGRALSFELSRRGFALILHGRNRTKLEAMADEIHAEHAMLGAPRPMILIAEADRCDRIDFEKLVQPLHRLRLTVLVNNVGAQGHLASDPFHALGDYTREDIKRLMDLNAMFTLLLTRELLPLLLKASDPSASDDQFDYPVKMKQRARAGKAPGARILTASSGAVVGAPYVVPYAASKGFIEVFTKALRNEFALDGYAESRIAVQCMRIGNVVTSTNPNRVRLFVPDAEAYGVAICNRIGCPDVITVPYFWHWFQIVTLGGLAPQRLQDRGIRDNMRWQIEGRRKIDREGLAGKGGKVL